MTQRLAMAILLTVLGTLVVAGLTAYFTVRAVLIGNLDAVLFARAAALPELTQTKNLDPSKLPVYDPTDRYVIEDIEGRRIQGAAQSVAASNRPTIVKRQFAPAGRRRTRILTIRGLAHAQENGAKPVPVVITYSGSMDRADAILGRLAMDLSLFGLVGALLAAYLAVKISQLTLRPLSRTAALIGTIDEQSLDFRIDASKLPPELVPIASRLNGMLAQLEQAFARRKQFLADASHELRTPVAAMVTSLDVALRVPHDEIGYRQVIQECAADANLLRRLVQRLTEYAKGEVSPQAPPERTDVRLLIEQCANRTSILGHADGVIVTSDLPASLSCLLYADRLRSIVMNLAANAMEYGRPRSEVEISCMHDGQRLILNVHDDGPGIAPEHLPHVFEPFYRADRARVQDSEHLGLGLFLVQAHAKAMNGTCFVTCQPGSGTTVTVQIPCLLLPAEEPSPARPLVAAR